MKKTYKKGYIITDEEGNIVKVVGGRVVNKKSTGIQRVISFLFSIL